MCVAMVIIYKKTLDKKGADDVTSKRSDLGPFQAQTMSQGTALFSCGLMESRRWRDHSCAMHQRPVGTSLESLWDVLPEAPSSSELWDWDVGTTSSTITSLLQDLNLTEAASSTAPPSKRQCRSLSCSEELSGCRTTWRPQGSRVWTAVEKRRCHSGGSVQRGSIANAQLGFPAMQRSSSFSLPARSNNTLEPPSLAQRPPWPSAFTCLTPSSSVPAEPRSQTVYLSDEQISLPEPRGASPPSSPDSTPELERRGGQGGLSRSRSQPCVLNDKKIGVKRRRPADTHKQRPSLDLAKMTQKLRNFHSLSCPGITGDDVSESIQALPTLRSTDDSPATQHRLDDVQTRTKDEGISRSTGDDWISTDFVRPGTTNGKDSEPLWAGLCSMRRDVYQLGGELDIEQIERN